MKEPPGPHCLLLGAPLSCLLRSSSEGSLSSPSSLRNTPAGHTHPWGASRGHRGNQWGGGCRGQPCPCAPRHKGRGGLAGSPPHTHAPQSLTEAHTLSCLPSLCLARGSFLSPQEKFSAQPVCPNLRGQFPSPQQPTRKASLHFSPVARHFEPSKRTLGV